jgi:hypothetical protein
MLKGVGTQAGLQLGGELTDARLMRGFCTERPCTAAAAGAVLTVVVVMLLCW